MILIYFILIALALFSIRFLKKEERWNSDYMSKDTGNVVKGVCIWMVFIRHISSYMYEIPALDSWDTMLFYMDDFVKQLLVVPFLFYSGYGVTLALVKKGDDYADTIPKNRVLRTLINFDIAVFLFLIMNLALGFELDIRKVLLAFTGWESIRNSNWYIFCIIICYLISWISYKIGSGISRRMILAVWAFILLYTAVMYFFKGHWWYDTIYAYGAGVVFACHRQKLETIIKKHYIAVLLVAGAGFLVFYNAPNYFSIAADITAVFTCILLVLFTIKLRLKSRILTWSGQHLFPLYIYQRLPMVVLYSVCGGVFMNQHYYLYIISCITITALIAWGYGYVNNLKVFSPAVWLKKT